MTLLEGLQRGGGELHSFASAFPARRLKNSPRASRMTAEVLAFSAPATFRLVLSSITWVNSSGERVTVSLRKLLRKDVHLYYCIYDFTACFLDSQ